MMGRSALGRVEASRRVDAPAADVFAAMVDLSSQDRWMLGTKLFALEGEVAVPEVGSRIAALTGIAGIGVLDTMTVTVYEPPHRWETVHTGKAFRGVGVFRVEPAGSGCLVTWGEEIPLPFGALGGVGWKMVRPLVRWGLSVSLRKLGKGVRNGTLPVSRAAGSSG